jgi:hypothetical protein
MLGPKFVRSILILIGAVLAVSLFVLSFNQPAPTGASLSTPPPRTAIPTDEPAPPPPPDGKEDSEGEDTEQDSPRAAIYGQVTDLSTGQPGQGLEVEINGIIVNTDSDGQFSLTGLDAGTYTVVLRLPDQATATQSSTEVYLAEQQTVTLDLSYYSQPSPSPTPADVPEPTPAPSPTEAITVEEVAPVTQKVSETFSPLTPFAGGTPAVWINPGHINNEKGVIGNIAIDVANVSDFGAFQATLEFNPKLIQVEDVILGNFLGSTGRETNPLVTETDNTTGEISFVAFTSGGAAGPNGGGTLAVVNFISKQTGVSDLELNNVLLVTRLGETINARVGDGRVNVTACFGDLNDDDVIDVGDVQVVAGRANQSVGDPNYVPEYDLNNDGVINDEDVTLVTDRLYETCP